MRDKLFLTLLIIFSVVLHKAWFFSYETNSYSDWGYYTAESQRELFSLPYIWNSSHQGYVDLGLSFYPINVLWGALSFVTDFAMSERLLYFFPSVLVSIIGSYLLIRKLTGSVYGAFFGAMIFTYNTYFLNGRLGHLTLMTAFAIAPLSLLFFILSLEKRSYWYSLATCISAVIISFYEFRGFYIIAWIYIFYFCYYLFFVVRSDSIMRRSIKLLPMVVLPLSFVVVANFYWLYAYTALGTLTSNEIFSRGLFGTEFLPLANSITLSHPFWTGAVPAAFVSQPIPFYRWLWPILAVAGLWSMRKDRNAIFFAMISVLGILLAKQDNPPFAQLYSWLYDSIPGFNAFREASKFFFITALGYSVLVGFWVTWLWDKKTTRLVRVSQAVVSIVILSIVVIESRGYFTGDVRTLISPRFIPNDYTIVNRYIADKDEYFKTLWVPSKPRWSINTQLHSRNDTHWLIYNLLSSFVAERRQVGSLNDDRLMIYLIKHPRFSRMLDLLSVKYVMVPLADDENEDNLFSFYQTTREEFIATLQSLASLEKIDIGTKEVVVFENRDYRKKIYTTTELDTYTKETQAVDLVATFLSPVEYRVTLKNVTEPLYLNFAESFHPDWSLRVGEFSPFKQFEQVNYYVPGEFHYQTDIKTNAWYIDPAYIKSSLDQNQYRVNKDGSLDIDVTVYFKTQSYVYVGMIIGAIGVLTILFTPVLIFYRSAARRTPRGQI